MLGLGEAFPLAVTEAMAAGVPCVVTDVGDCAVLVGDTGIVVPPQDPAVQAEAVSQLISLGREGRQELGAKARERVQKFYSTDIYRDEHDKLYRAVSLVRRPRPGSLFPPDTVFPDRGVWVGSW